MKIVGNHSIFPQKLQKTFGARQIAKLAIWQAPNITKNRQKKSMAQNCLIWQKMQKKNLRARAAREYREVPARAARESDFWSISNNLANLEFSHFLPKKSLFSKSVVFWIAILVNSDGLGTQNLGFE